MSDSASSFTGILNAAIREQTRRARADLVDAVAIKLAPAVLSNYPLSNPSPDLLACAARDIYDLAEALVSEGERRFQALSSEGGPHV